MSWETVPFVVRPDEYAQPDAMFLLGVLSGNVSVVAICAGRPSRKSASRSRFLSKPETPPAPAIVVAPLMRKRSSP